MRGIKEQIGRVCPGGLPRRHDQQAPAKFERLLELKRARREKRKGKKTAPRYRESVQTRNASGIESVVADRLPRWSKRGGEERRGEEPGLTDLQAPRTWTRKTE